MNFIRRSRAFKPLPVNNRPHPIHFTIKNLDGFPNFSQFIRLVFLIFMQRTPPKWLSGFGLKWGVHFPKQLNVLSELNHISLVNVIPHDWWYPHGRA
jgi:hypothetical protein